MSLDILLVVGLGLSAYGAWSLHLHLDRGGWVKAMACVLAVLLLWSGAAPARAAADSAGVASSDGAMAGSSSPPEELAPGSPDAGDIPSATVSQFVAAYLEVVDLIESREASLQRAETETESRQMQAEIQRQAIDLIQAHELTLQAYWELLGLANNDPEFREQVLAQVEEASL